MKSFPFSFRCADAGFSQLQVDFGGRSWSRQPRARLKLGSVTKEGRRTNHESASIWEQNRAFLKGISILLSWFLGGSGTRHVKPSLDRLPRAPHLTLSVYPLLPGMRGTRRIPLGIWGFTSLGCQLWRTVSHLLTVIYLLIDHGFILSSDA